MHDPLTVTPELMATLTAAAVLAVQLVKWMLPQSWALRIEAMLVIGVTALVELAWCYSVSDAHAFVAADVLGLLLMYLSIMAASAGVFGFVRANGGTGALTNGRDLAVGAPRLPGSAPYTQEEKDHEK